MKNSRLSWWNSRCRRKKQI